MIKINVEFTAIPKSTNLGLYGVPFNNRDTLRINELNSIVDIGIYDNTTDIFKSKVNELARINQDIDDSLIGYLNMHPYVLATDNITRLIDYPNNILKYKDYIWIFDSTIHDISVEALTLDSSISASTQVIFNNKYYSKYRAIRYVGEKEFFIYLASKSNTKFTDNYSIIQEDKTTHKTLKLFYSRLILTLNEDDLIVLYNGKIVMHGKEDKVKEIFNLSPI
ncbi:MAG: hypothetical protein R3Y29_05770 [bacterium]